MQIQFRPRFSHESEYFPCFFTRIGRWWISRLDSLPFRVDERPISLKICEFKNTRFVWTWAYTSTPDVSALFWMYVNIHLVREVFHTLQNFLVELQCHTFPAHKWYYWLSSAFSMFLLLQNVLCLGTDHWKRYWGWGYKIFSSTNFFFPLSCLIHVVRP